MKLFHDGITEFFNDKDLTEYFMDMKLTEDNAKMVFKEAFKHFKWRVTIASVVWKYADVQEK
jgi:hypothetical protein